MTQTQSRNITLLQRALEGIAKLALRPSLLLNIVLPIISYEVLVTRGLTETQALAAAATFPLAGIGIGVVRRGRLDILGVTAVGTIIVTIAAGLTVSDPRIPHPAIVTAITGLVLLVSLLAPRPLIFVLAQEFYSSQAETSARYENQWHTPGFRLRLRRLTLVWGLALIVEPAVRVAVAFVVASGIQTVVSPLLVIAIFGPVAWWHLRSRRELVPRSPATNKR